MRIQLKSVLAAGCLLAVSAFGAAAFEATTLEPAELREGPGWDFEPIVGLPAGSILEVLNCDREWCEASIEDFDGFVPRGVLDLGTYSPPLYAFPPLIAAPGLWHGRYYSRDHYRYESRARWRDREGRRLFVVPMRPQPRPLRPIGPNERRGQKQFDQRGPAADQRGKKQFDQRGPAADQERRRQFEQKGPAPDQRRIQREPERPRIQREPDRPRIQREPDRPRTTPQQPRPEIRREAPVQRQAPAPQRTQPQPQPDKKKQDQPR